LGNGWKVGKRDVKPPGTSGGYFSVGYFAEGPNGEIGYLKAHDYSKILGPTGGTRLLQAAVEAFNFERDLLERCGVKRMNRIVRSLDSGSVHVPTSQYPDVYYFIFEKADMDARMFLVAVQRLETAWILRTLHSMAVALGQLHREGIAHQDLKPSNVFVFPKDGSKLGDLGRSIARGTTAPHDQSDIKGALVYAPPELRYSAVPSDWEERHLACDLYLLGSLAVSFILGVQLSAAIESKMHASHTPRNWSGSYSGVLPYIRDAFGEVLDELGSHLHRDLRPRFLEHLRYLCEPDPKLRGHPRDRASAASPYGLQRFISEFNVLASFAEAGRFE
jgi:serine/threonine protein kinase